MDPATYIAEDVLLDINERRDPWSCETWMPQCRGMPGQGSGSGLVSEQGYRIGGFWKGILEMG